MDTSFKPAAGRYGVQPIAVDSPAIGTGGAAIAASAVTRFNIIVPRAKYWVGGLAIAASLAAAGGGAITGVLNKRDNSGAGADVPLTSAFDLVAGFTVLQKSLPLVFLTTLTDAQRILQPGDQLVFIVTAASTVTQQPANCQVAAELLVLA